MKAFILQLNQGWRYAFIRTVISILLVTAGPASETELPVCLYMFPHYRQHGNQLLNQVTHITVRTQRLQLEKSSIACKQSGRVSPRTTVRGWDYFGPLYFSAMVFKKRDRQLFQRVIFKGKNTSDYIIRPKQLSDNPVIVIPPFLIIIFQAINE
ncbi:hypothetical protein AMECASPLE_039608 [Ameca splendens]|uniref:Secreted protein n=1 Tax=Ameca splendens TaxID=208324 RepID=A0ABV0XXF7_9TELE